MDIERIDLDGEADTELLTFTNFTIRVKDGKKFVDALERFCKRWAVDNSWAFAFKGESETAGGTK